MEVDINKVIEVLRRDNPKELERAMMLVHIENLEQELQLLKSDRPQVSDGHDGQNKASFEDTSKIY